MSYRRRATPPPAPSPAPSWLLPTLAADVPGRGVPASPEEVRADLVGAPYAAWMAAYAASVALADRKAAGIYYTPEPLVRDTLDLVGFREAPGTVVDPCCGAGAFLLGAQATFSDKAAFALTCAGRDTDAAAAYVARALLWREAGLPWSAFEAIDVREGDSIVDTSWATSHEYVLTNPPYLSYRGRDASLTAAMKASMGAAYNAYADAAFCWLCLGAKARRFAAVLPASALCADSAEGARSAYAGRPVAVRYYTETEIFDGAKLDVCAVASGRGRPAPRGGWGHLVAADAGLPQLPERTTRRTLGDVATFRAEHTKTFYDLADVLADDGDGLKVVTTGTARAGRHLWGEKVCTLAGRKMLRPTVPADTPACANARGLKAVFAQQTRVVEAFADVDGDVIPSVPLVYAKPSLGVTPDMLAAAACSPLASLAARLGSLGLGMGPGRIRLTTALARTLPAPDDMDLWREATGAFNTGTPEAYAKASMRALGVDDAIGADVVAWWLSERRG